MDVETGSKWARYGKRIGGKLQKLDPILPSFWFLWAEFFPETQVFTAAANE